MTSAALTNERQDLSLEIGDLREQCLDLSLDS
jgi:hypothetical protein